MTQRLSVVVRHTRWPLLGVVAFAALSLLLTSLVAGTLAKGVSGSTRTYRAVFTDVTGLRKGDDVRIAGVRVGNVKAIDLQGSHALVTLSVAADQSVYQATNATVDYLNLMGQRYVGLSVGADHGPVLPEGATIPVSRTHAGLDLTALFNAFKPVFDLIKPADVNKLAVNLVKTLQGEGPTLRDLAAQTARLTAHFADRDQVIGAVISNVTTVMRTLDGHRAQISGLIHQLDDLTGTVAKNTTEIGATIDDVQSLVTSFTSLVTAGQADVDADVASLSAWSAAFAAEAPQLAGALKWTQDLVTGYIKSLGVGSYLNTYVCKSSLQLASGGKPALTVPLLPNGASSERCREPGQ